MKNTFVRAAVMTLAFAGFAASSFATRTHAKTLTNAKISTASSFLGSNLPVPMCAPSDPTHCGLH